MLAVLRSIDLALDRITKSTTISDAQAHATRKALKKARAALRLLRPTLGHLVYRRENAALRDASRLISQLRDAKAKTVVLRSLGKRHSRWSKGHWIAVESAACAELERLRSALNINSPRMRVTRRLLNASRRRLTTLKVRNNNAKDIERALRRIYRDSRKAFDIAKHDRRAASLHEWRKKVKYFANAIDVLGIHASHRVIKLERDAERLGDCLGEEHDLAVLADAMTRSRRSLTSRAKDTLHVAIATRRAQLQREAFSLGERCAFTSPRT